MELFRIKHDIPFMRYATGTSIVSALTFVLAVVAIVLRGFNFSVDFTGGTVMELRYAAPAELAEVRDTLTGHEYPDASVQHFGATRDVLIRLPIREGKTSAQLSEDVFEVLKTQSPEIKLQRVEFVGPQVGEELVNDGGLALILVSFGIMLYLALRFEWRFAVAAIVATLHDVVIILGCFSWFQWEFSLSVLAAVLAILGYSVNDTVVVFDRIRENFRTMRSGSVPQIIDNAITRTLSRTIITHVTTQLMVFSMLFLGGEVLFYFALALTLGIVIGTYSSVLVASPIVMWLGISKLNLAQVKKEGTADDGARP